MGSASLIDCCESVRSAILATAWLLVIVDTLLFKNCETKGRDLQ